MPGFEVSFNEEIIQISIDKGLYEQKALEKRQDVTARWEENVNAFLLCINK